VVVEAVSGYTDLLTRAFLQVPSAVRSAAFLLVRRWLALSGPRKLMIRRATMIGFGYDESPLLDQKSRAAGVRLPNPLLHSPTGTDVRLYDILPNAPAILDVGGRAEAAGELPIEHIIRIGRNGFEDRSGLLRGLLGGEDGLILVRPDLHVAWARTSMEGIHEATARALGQRLT
jgi:hypothetical protein